MSDVSLKRFNTETGSTQMYRTRILHYFLYVEWILSGRAATVSSYMLEDKIWG